MTPGRCCDGRSGVHSTRRRATPSSSSIASAAVSWSLAREQHARAAQFLEPPAEGGMPREIGELNYAAGAVQAPGRGARWR